MKAFYYTHTHTIRSHCFFFALSILLHLPLLSISTQIFYFMADSNARPTSCGHFARIHVHHQSLKQHQTFFSAIVCHNYKSVYVRCFYQVLFYCVDAFEERTGARRTDDDAGKQTRVLFACCAFTHLFVRPCVAVDMFNLHGIHRNVVEFRVPHSLGKLDMRFVSGQAATLFLTIDLLLSGHKAHVKYPSKWTKQSVQYPNGIHLPTSTYVHAQAYGQ